MLVFSSHEHLEGPTESRQVWPRQHARPFAGELSLSSCLVYVHTLYPGVVWAWHWQDYAAAARLYNQLAEEDEENKCEYLSLIGRLYLQVRGRGRMGHGVRRSIK